jgi:hypothetical protein
MINNQGTQNIPLGTKDVHELLPNQVVGNPFQDETVFKTPPKIRIDDPIVKSIEECINMHFARLVSPLTLNPEETSGMIEKLNGRGAPDKWNLG